MKFMKKNGKVVVSDSKKSEKKEKPSKYGLKGKSKK
jgi:hypothetical protein